MSVVDIDDIPWLESVPVVSFDETALNDRNGIRPVEKRAPISPMGSRRPTLWTKQKLSGCVFVMHCRPVFYRTAEYNVI